MGQRIKIDIPRSGLSTGKATVRAEVEGIVGDSCSTLTKSLLDRLGATVETEELKPEYFQQKLTQQQNQSLDG